MRRGFGMIQVIFFMVILSGILAISLKYASISVKQTEDLYIKEQGELFMQSAIELALLGISSTAIQINEVYIVSDDKRFTADINITQYYKYGTNLETQASNGMISMDIVVETNDTHPKNNRELKLTKRSLQRL
jgi:hypothetical protein